MFKTKATRALELLDQFRWIFQEVTNHNAEVLELHKKKIMELENRLSIIEASYKNILAEDLKNES